MTHIGDKNPPMAPDDATLLLLTGVCLVALLVDLCFIAARSALLAALLRATTPTEQVTGAWRELQDTAADLGIDWPDATPRQLARAGWPGLDASGRSALARIALLVEQQRYAPRLPEQVSAAADVALVRAQWLADASWWRRVAATVAPMSLVSFTKPRETALSKDAKLDARRLTADPAEFKQCSTRDRLRATPGGLPA